MIQPVAYVMAVPKEDDVVEGGGGYEPGQGSQPAHDIDPPGSQPVDVSHPEEESHYVPHIAGGDEAGESSQSAGIAGSG